MDLPQNPTFLAIVAVAALAGFALGRLSARQPGDGERTAARAAENAVMLSANARGDVEKLIDENRVIEAVKLCREKTGLGLKEAKEVVDHIRANR